VFGNPGSNELPFLQSNSRSDFPIPSLRIDEGVRLWAWPTATPKRPRAAPPLLVNFVQCRPPASGTPWACLGQRHHYFFAYARFGGHGRTADTRAIDSRLEAPAPLNVDAQRSFRGPLVKWMSTPPRARKDVRPRHLARAIYPPCLPLAGPCFFPSSVPYDDWPPPAEDSRPKLFLDGTPRTSFGAVTALSGYRGMAAAGPSHRANPVLIVGAEVDEPRVPGRPCSWPKASRCPVWMRAVLRRANPFPTIHPLSGECLPLRHRSGSHRELTGRTYPVSFGAPGLSPTMQYVAGAYLPEVRSSVPPVT